MSRDRDRQRGTGFPTLEAEQRREREAAREGVKHRAMKLLNCTTCDDVFRLTTIMRFCECGQSGGGETADQNIEKHGPCRILSIPWEEYDGAYPGAVRKFHVLP